MRKILDINLSICRQEFLGMMLSKTRKAKRPEERLNATIINR